MGVPCRVPTCSSGLLSGETDISVLSHSHVASHTDGTATGSNLGFSMLPKVAWTCSRSRGSNHRLSERWSFSPTSCARAAPCQPPDVKGSTFVVSSPWEQAARWHFSQSYTLPSRTLPNEGCDELSNCCPVQLSLCIFIFIIICPSCIKWVIVCLVTQSINFGFENKVKKGTFKNMK